MPVSLATFKLDIETSTPSPTNKCFLAIDLVKTVSFYKNSFCYFVHCFEFKYTCLDFFPWYTLNCKHKITNRQILNIFTTNKKNNTNANDVLFDFTYTERKRTEYTHTIRK